MTDDLERALDEFRGEMLAKFRARASRHGSASVTLDGNLDRLGPADVWGHFMGEVSERMAAGSPAECAAEDVDVANMAFLDWYAIRRLAMRTLYPAPHAQEDCDQCLGSDCSCWCHAGRSACAFVARLPDAAGLGTRLVGCPFGERDRVHVGVPQSGLPAHSWDPRRR